MREVQDTVVSFPARQPATALVPGRDFLRNYAELRAWFPDDGACVDYLEWLRWPQGFVCPRVAATVRVWRTAGIGASPAIAGCRSPLGRSSTARARR